MSKRKKLIIFLFIIIIVITIVVLYKTINTKIFENKEIIKEEAEVLKLIDGKIYIEVYMNPSISENDKSVEKLKKELEEKEYLYEIEFISKQEALNTMKDLFDNNGLLDTYEGDNNIFPNSYKALIKINDFSQFNNDYFTKINKELEALENVHKVKNVGFIYESVYRKEGFKGLKDFMKLTETNNNSEKILNDTNNKK